jgi:hypothetical protein
MYMFQALLRWGKKREIASFLKTAGLASSKLVWEEADGLPAYDLEEHPDRGLNPILRLVWGPVCRVERAEVQGMVNLGESGEVRIFGLVDRAYWYEQPEPLWVEWYTGMDLASGVAALATGMETVSTMSGLYKEGYTLKQGGGRHPVWEKIHAEGHEELFVLDGKVSHSWVGEGAKISLQYPISEIIEGGTVDKLNLELRRAGLEQAYLEEKIEQERRKSGIDL